jgi:Na+/melibiose symporter-like transporter
VASEHSSILVVTPVSPIFARRAHDGSRPDRRARYCVAEGVRRVTATATTTARTQFGSVLRNRNFAVFFSAAIVSNSGTWMQQVAVFALIFDLSGHRGAWLGLVSLASSLPMIVLTPIAGVLADRLPRRLILTVTQLVQAAAAFALWVLHVGDDLTSWRVVGLVFVGGVAGGFQVAAWQSFVPTLVPRSQLVEAVQAQLGAVHGVARARAECGRGHGQLLGHRGGDPHQCAHLPVGRRRDLRHAREPGHRDEGDAALLR